MHLQYYMKVKGTNYMFKFIITLDHGFLCTLTQHLLVKGPGELDKASELSVSESLIAIISGRDIDDYYN